AVIDLHCPQGPPRVRENYGFKSNELRRILAAVAANLAILCLIPTFVMIDTLQSVHLCLQAGSACSLSHRERGGVRGCSPSRVQNPLTPTPSPTGQGSAPKSPRPRQITHPFVTIDTLP